jgi:hypothetical protein
MKVLVCGGREWNDWKTINNTLRGLGPLTIIIHGDCRGADKMAGHVAKGFGYEVRPYPANWAKHGKAAGPIRNRLMYDTEKPELVIAFHNDLKNSSGTKDMVAYARSHGTPVNVVTSEDV